MTRFLSILALLGLAAGTQSAEPGKAVKSVSIPPAKELAEPIRALLSDEALQVTSAGKPVCDVWLRKELPLKAGTNPTKGVSYRDLPESSVVGAVRFHQPWSSFRKQKLKAGVYTLRFALQPMDGDHMGTAPYNEFLLLAPAAGDQKPDLLETKAMFQLSGKSLPGNSHPIVLLLFPNPQPEGAAQLVDKGNDIWVLNCKGATQPKGTLGLGLTLFGASESE
jgi:hypothetical protein